jgi:hypothetical protein
MALQFNPAPYLDVWQRNQQIQAQRPDLNATVSQPILQGLQLMADSRRQQQLVDLQKQKIAQDQRQNDYEYGAPIDPNAEISSPTGQMAQSSFMPGAPARPSGLSLGRMPGPAAPAQRVATGGRLVDAFNTHGAREG